jgi:hypothetical protein
MSRNFASVGSALARDSRGEIARKRASYTGTLFGSREYEENFCNCMDLA